jgi:hypothetical protein
MKKIIDKQTHDDPGDKIGEEHEGLGNFFESSAPDLVEQQRKTYL